jgi:hypothetical protein
MNIFKIIIDEYNNFLRRKFGIFKIGLYITYPEDDEMMLSIIKYILYRSEFRKSEYYREEYREIFEKYIENIV